MTTYRLPLPPSELSPNARVHWAKRAKAAREYRDICGWEAKAQMDQVGAKLLAGFAHVKITFCHDDYRLRDWDNLLASFKAGLDGLVDAGALHGDSTGDLASLTIATVFSTPGVLVEVT